jgi:glutamine synthetase
MLLTESQKLSIEAIRLLEKAIKRDFGVTVKMGAEQEYSVFPPLGVDANPLKLTRTAEQHHIDWEQGASSIPKYFYNYYHVVAHYREELKNQYELVFGHENGSPEILGKAILHARYLLRKLAQREKLNLSFNGLQKNEDPKSDIHISQALHINASIWDDEGHNIFESETRQSNRYIANEVLLLSKELLAVIAPRKNLLRRFSNTSGCPPHNFNFTEKGSMFVATQMRHGEYMENRLPSADCDPLHAIVISLIAIYQGLQAEKRKEILPAMIDHGPIITMQNDAMKRLQNCTRFESTLNSISGGDLGTRLSNAIKTEIIQGQNSELYYPAIPSPSRGPR